ncbi:MAG TPA: dihydrodipicolinate reductase C-terminal domain-containing protein [Alphaproteobacteria bacterium]|nr:dihydrodipicolinate reductase C-terminal domain-containing protein [Alphaproteobacteria bacterium]
MIKIGLLGYTGRMGKLIAEEIAANDACVLAGGAVRPENYEKRAAEYKEAEGILITPKADEVIAISDVVVDFTLAGSVTDHARLAATHKKPYMTGVTGLAPGTQDALKQAAAKIPVLYAPNTSLSLATMKQIVSLASKLLSPFDYDISILDEHHRMKKDAPSGTAKALGEAVARGNNNAKTPSYASVRAGSIVGEHEVVLAGAGEVIRLRHSVTNRRVFARGALQAALWLHSKPPGFYGMDDVVGI